MLGVLGQRLETGRREAGVLTLGPVGPPGWGPSGSGSCITRSTTTSSPVRRRLPNLSLPIGLMPKQFTLRGPCREGSWDLHSVNVRLEVEIEKSGGLLAPQPTFPRPQLFINLQFCCFADGQGGAVEGLEGVVVL